MERYKKNLNDKLRKQMRTDYSEFSIFNETPQALEDKPLIKRDIEGEYEIIEPKKKKKKYYQRER